MLCICSSTCAMQSSPSLTAHTLMLVFECCCCHRPLIQCQWWYLSLALSLSLFPCAFLCVWQQPASLVMRSEWKDQRFSENLFCFYIDLYVAVRYCFDNSQNRVSPARFLVVYISFSIHFHFLSARLPVGVAQTPRKLTIAGAWERKNENAGVLSHTPLFHLLHVYCSADIVFGTNKTTLWYVNGFRRVNLKSNHAVIRPDLFVMTGTFRSFCFSLAEIRIVNSNWENKQLGN